MDDNCVRTSRDVGSAGTAVGVYGLWFVFGDQGKAFFDGPDFIPPPAPPPNNWA
jgi:hypothetical protein